jgi:hypothetical protein
MPRFLIPVLALLVAPAWLQAEDKIAHNGIELTYLGIDRVTNYRELTVKDAKKEELALVRLSIAWTGDKRQIVIKDSDVSLHESSGKKRGPALNFVQALAEPGETVRTIEVPFRVAKGVRLTTLRMGKSFLRIEAAPTAETMPSTPAPPSPQ